MNTQRHAFGQNNIVYSVGHGRVRETIGDRRENGEVKSVLLNLFLLGAANMADVRSGNMPLFGIIRANLATRCTVIVDDHENPSFGNVFRLGSSLVRDGFPMGTAGNNEKRAKKQQIGFGHGMVFANNSKVLAKNNEVPGNNGEVIGNNGEVFRKNFNIIAGFFKVLAKNSKEIAKNFKVFRKNFKVSPNIPAKISKLPLAFGGNNAVSAAHIPRMIPVIGAKRRGKQTSGVNSPMQADLGLALRGFRFIGV